MQGGGHLPWNVTCRGVVDGIAMVIHMDAPRRAAVRGRSRRGERLRRRDKHMGRATTRPRDGLRACRAHVVILPVRTTRLTVGPAAGGRACSSPYTTNQESYPLTDLETNATGETEYAGGQESGRHARRHHARGRGAFRRRAPSAGPHMSSTRPRRAVTDHRAAAEAWDALATQASDYRRGAALADRTRHRWAR